MKKKLIRFAALALSVLTVFQSTGTGVINALAADYYDGEDYDEGYDLEYDLYDEDDNGDDEFGGSSGSFADEPEEVADHYELNPSTSIIYFEDVYESAAGQGSRVNISNYCNKTVDLAWTQSGSDIFNISAPYLSGISPMDYSTFNIYVNDYVPAGSYNGSLTVWVAEDTSLQSAVTIRFYVTVYKETHTPVVHYVSLSPDSVTLDKKQSFTFSSYVSGDYLDDYSVTYSINGQNSAGTYITDDGTITIGKDETSSSIYVYCFSNQDPNAMDFASVNIKPDSYQVAVQANPKEGGVVTGGNTYTKGSTASLNASANNGYVFTGWTLNGSSVATTNRYDVKVNGSGTYVANFKKVNVFVLLDVNPSTECGTITASNYVAYGGEMTIKAEPARGYKFTGWKENNNIISKDANFKVTNITTDRHITACFEKNRATVQTLPSIDNAGVVNGAGTYDFGANVTLSAKPFSGYVFTGWFCNNQLVSTNASYTINNLDKDYCFIAGFAKEDVKNYTIKASAPATGGSISPNGNNVIPNGGSVTYSIVAAQGYKISSVMVDGVNVGAVYNYTFTNVSSDHKIEVSFEKQAQAPANTTPATPESPKQDTSTADNNTPKQDTSSDSVDVNIDPSHNPTNAESTDAFIPGTDTIVDNCDTDYSQLTGILAMYDITREEASYLIDNNQAEDLFYDAYMHGYLQMTVNTDYSQNSQPTATGDFYNNPSIVNYTELMEKLFTKEDLLDALEGTPVSINVDIIDYSKDIPVYYQQVLAQIADGYNKQVDSYFDITLIKTNKNGSTLIRDFEGTNALFVIQVPKECIGRELSVIHYHLNDDGSIEKELLEDLDDDPTTITISVGKLSVFAIVEDQQHPVVATVFKIIVIVIIIATLSVLTFLIYMMARKHVRRIKHKKAKKAEHSGHNEHKNPDEQSEHKSHSDHSDREKF